LSAKAIESNYFDVISDNIVGNSCGFSVIAFFLSEVYLLIGSVFNTTRDF
jgi:hypothetical protein